MRPLEPPPPPPPPELSDEGLRTRSPLFLEELCVERVDGVRELEPEPPPPPEGPLPMTVS